MLKEFVAKIDLIREEWEKQTPEHIVHVDEAWKRLEEAAKSGTLSEMIHHLFYVARIAEIGRETADGKKSRVYALSRVTKAIFDLFMA